MEKIISRFMIIFALLTSTIVKAQITNQAEAKKEIATGMAIFVDDLRPYYQTGMSYATFKINLFGSHILPANGGEKLIAKSFQYLQNGTSYETIISTDNINEMGYFVKSIINLHSVDAGLIHVFGVGYQDTPFGQDDAMKTPKWLKKIGKWFEEHLDEIIIGVIGGAIDHILWP